MKSVADDLRSETGDRVLRLPVPARIELALALGRADVSLYAEVNGVTPDTARRDLAAQRARGRHDSRSASPGR